MLQYKEDTLRSRCNITTEVKTRKEDDKRSHPKYTLEFKQDAARLVLEMGYSYQQAAESLGISMGAIGRWVRAERVAVHSPRVLSLSDQAELARLRRENRQLKLERDTLKRRQASTPGKPSEVCLYSGATEDLSRDPVMPFIQSQHQRL